MMKFKRDFWRKSLLVLLAGAMAWSMLAFTACSNSDSDNDSGNNKPPVVEEPETVDEVAGVYTQYLSTDEIWDYMRSFQASTSSKEAQTVYELNTLVLTKGGGEMLRPTQENRLP